MKQVVEAFCFFLICFLWSEIETTKAFGWMMKDDDDGTKDYDDVHYEYSIVSYKEVHYL